MPVLIVGRALAALGGCAGMVWGRAIVRDVYDRERSARALATIMMVMSLVPSLSPAVGACLRQWVNILAGLLPNPASASSARAL